MSKLGKIYSIAAIISLASFLIIRFILGAWIPFLWVCLGLFLLFFGLAIFQERKTLKSFLNMKTTKQGMSMGAIIAIMLTFLIVVNIIGVRKYKTFDFSLSKANSLSEQSLKVIDSFKEEIKVIYFYQKGGDGVEENRRAFIETIKKYQDKSSLIKLEFVDVNERPDLTEKYGVTKGSGTVFLEYKERKAQLQKIDEQEITSAMVKVSRDKDKVIYFTVGHGERDLGNDKEVSGGAFLKQLLEGNRYIVKTLSLIETPDVPTDADVLIIAGPQQSFLESEVKAIEKFLDRGGNIMLSIKPKVKHGLNSLLLKTGIVFKDNYLVNFVETAIGRAVNPQVTVGGVFSATNEVTKIFPAKQFTVFRLPQEVATAEKMPEGYNAESIVKTLPQTLAYNDTKFEGEGKLGTFTLVQMVNKTSEPQAHMMVLGDSEILDNQLLYQNLNRDLVLNGVSYLAKEDNLISIAPREVGITKLEMTPTQFSIFVICFDIMLPLSLFAAFATLWVKRRYA